MTLGYIVKVLSTVLATITFFSLIADLKLVIDLTAVVVNAIKDMTNFDQLIDLVATLLSTVIADWRAITRFIVEAFGISIPQILADIVSIIVFSIFRGLGVWVQTLAPLPALEAVQKRQVTSGDYPSDVDHGRAKAEARLARQEINEARNKAYRDAAVLKASALRYAITTAVFFLGAFAALYALDYIIYAAR